ncbi:5-formyltetrahydrofolate cyclo-ligase [Maritalea mediterranea]|uniref:5-formyltetrahydrofolate cyclo-ligase n=1 Tax=Maritalea mediterranea TaxID=2909667 RepID=A0ABS9E9V7_9HYPH|nr:5-formyltetrahydrofolate cyclo-ligase [Maritalea mediterranea]MCF4099670.1 5-formyltetrahydrofolate cyclo-ligase [Maritalea mediterranea]
MTDTTLEQQDAIDAVKAQMRKEAHARRASLSDTYRKEAAKAAAETFIAAVPVPYAQTISIYWAIRDELDCTPLLTHFMDDGHRVCLPVVMGRDLPLEMRLWAPTDPLVPNGFNTMAPPAGAETVVPDIVVTPLLGFDGTGTRLGYGGGYYDRSLASWPQKPLLVGYAFGVQEFDHLPRDTHDVPLDMVVTENGVRRFSEG